MINKSVDESIFNSILEQAFTEAFISEMNILECESVVEQLPTKNKYRKVERKAYKKKTLGHSDIYFISKRIAVGFLIVFSINFTLMIASPSVRAEAINTVVKFFEKYMSFDFSKEDYQVNVFGEYTLSYIPDGFIVEHNNEEQLITSCVLKNENANQEVTLRYTNGDQVDI